MKIIISLIIFISYSNHLSAQKQFSGWLATFNTFKTGKKTSIHSDIQWRSADDLQYTQSLILRTGLNYHLNKKTTITGGYAFIHNYRNTGGVDGYVPEHRIWEQFLYHHKWNKVNISHRFRLEQRFIGKTVVDNNRLKNDGSLYANRFRYFIRNVWPLNHQPTFTRGMFAALQNELFFNFGNKRNVNGKTFDQNRLYTAVGHRFNKSFDIEAGYMNQYVNGRTVDVNNHIVQIAGYIRL
ncbi:MAG: DUF2490 domain-containing protein [Rhizobacter sp.]|nr:DUF2490 domain-containing protein [Ferruginibacter sp.]